MFVPNGIDATFDGEEASLTPEDSLEADVLPVGDTTPTEGTVTDDADLISGPAWEAAGITCLGAQTPSADGCDCESNWDSCGVPESDGIQFHGAVALAMGDGTLPGAVVAYVQWIDPLSPYCKCHQMEGIRLYLIDKATMEVCLGACCA